MNRRHSIQAILVILTSFVLASMANIYPLGFGLAYFRPMFMMMVLMFWAIYQPKFVGIAVAFLVGLSCDLLLDTTLGTQAFGSVMAVLLVQIVRGFTKRLSLSSAWILTAMGLIIYRIFMWIFESFSYDYVGFSAFFGLMISILIFPALWWLLLALNNKIDNLPFV